jgi:hypothetical protein
MRTLRRGKRVSASRRRDWLETRKGLGRRNGKEDEPRYHHDEGRSTGELAVEVAKETDGEGSDGGGDVGTASEGLAREVVRDEPGGTDDDHEDRLFAEERLTVAEGETEEEHRDGENVPLGRNRVHVPGNTGAAKRSCERSVVSSAQEREIERGKAKSGEGRKGKKRTASVRQIAAEPVDGEVRHAMPDLTADRETESEEERVKDGIDEANGTCEKEQRKR